MKQTFSMLLALVAVVVIIAAIGTFATGTSSAKVQTSDVSSAPAQLQNVIVIEHGHDDSAPTQKKTHIDLFANGVSPSSVKLNGPATVTFFNRAHTWQGNLHNSDEEEDGGITNADVLLTIPSLGQSFILRYGEQIDVQFTEGTHTFSVSDRDLGNNLVRAELSGTIVVE